MLAGAQATGAVEAVAVWHHDQQRSFVVEGELLSKEACVALGLAPELGDRSQVRCPGDHGDTELVPNPACRGEDRVELFLLGGGKASVLRQEQRLGEEDVAGGVTVGSGHACERAGQQRHQRDRDACEQPAIGPQVVARSVRTVQQCGGRSGVSACGAAQIAAGGKSMSHTAGRTCVLMSVLVGVLFGAGGLPDVAAAHGPVAPIASSYEARVAEVPAGVEAKVIDGDQRMWLRVDTSETVLVLDYRGAPYLRFSPSGVAVNGNSVMYYLNRTPAEVPPSNLRPTTAPRWSSLSGAHDYSWHDGRLHALATVALAPGASYVGRWSIPVRVDERVSAIAGALWHAGDPSIVWFWPIVVLLACTLAVWRVRRAELDAIGARVLGFAALAGIACATVGRDLHGRPEVSVFQLIALAALVGFVAWGLRQLLLRRAGYCSYFAIALVAAYEGAQLVPTLLNGFVLAAVPAVVARAAAVVCLGCAGGLLLLSFRLADLQREETEDREEFEDEFDEDYRAWG